MITPVALIRRIRTLRMLARTALTPEMSAVYGARVELAWMHAKRQGRAAWARSVSAHNARHGLPISTPYVAA